MVQFGDKGGACDNTDSDVRETTLEPQNDSIVVGKKRPPSTFHPETLGGTKKRSPEKFRGNEGNHMDGQLLTCNTEQNIDKSNSLTQANTIGNFESTRPNDPASHKGKESATPANLAGQEEKRTPKSSNSNEAADSKAHESEDRLEMVGEESSGADDQNGNENNRWEEFVDSVDTNVIPNLDAYMKAKAIRTEASMRFVNAIDACIQRLRDTKDEILSEVVGPISSDYSDRFDATEESIIKTLVSNHLRRNELLEFMQNADVAWSHKYNKITTEIMGQSHGGQKSDIDRDTTEEGNGKVVGSNKAKVSRKPSKGMFHEGFSSGGNKEKTIFGQEDSDWEELLEYEPSRERILSFLDERVKRNHTMRAFEKSLEDVNSGMEREFQAILQMALDVYNQHETVCLKSEDEIEYFVLDNYERRGNLQKELEKSAQHAQGLFANLLSRLSQPVS